MRIALGSLRSSGVTTSALALLRSWPTERSVVLAEIDPAGGTLAARLAAHGEPGLQSLAAEARRGLGADALVANSQPLTDNAAVLLAPAAGERVRAALAMLGDLERAFESSVDLLADCGRLDAASPVMSLFRAADCSILVTRPELSDLQAIAAMSEARGLVAERVRGHLGLIVVGSGTYGPDEITDALSVPVLGVLPSDALGLRVVAMPGPARAVLRRCALLRSARSLAERLVALANDGAPSEVAASTTAASTTEEITSEEMMTEGTAVEETHVRESLSTSRWLDHAPQHMGETT